MMLMVKKLLGLYDEALQKTNQTEFRAIKVRKKKGDKLHFK